MVRFIADVICEDNESDVQVKNELCGRSKDYQDLHKTAQRTLQ